MHNAHMQMVDRWRLDSFSMLRGRVTGDSSTHVHSMSMHFYSVQTGFLTYNKNYSMDCLKVMCAVAASIHPKSSG